MDEVNHPNLYLLYDVYHMQITEGNLAGTIAENIARIGHVQVADVPGRHEPGTGEINFNYLFRHLDTIGYDGCNGCQYNPLLTTYAGLEWIRAASAAVEAGVVRSCAHPAPAIGLVSSSSL